MLCDFYFHGFVVTLLHKVQGQNEGQDHGVWGALSSRGFAGFDDLLEHREIAGKRFAAFAREGVAGLRAILDFLDDGHVTGIVERPQMADEVSVAETEFGFQILERPTPLPAEYLDGQPLHHGWN